MTMETWLEELGEPACIQHLRTAVIGRLGVVVDGGPQIFPVNHVFDDDTGCVVFPTNARTKLFAATHSPSVAFEVDGVDPSGKSAWSVLVIGRAEEITDPEEARRSATRRLVLWAVGDYTHWVRIVPDKITGRRISTIPATGILA